MSKSTEIDLDLYITQTREQTDRGESVVFELFNLLCASKSTVIISCQSIFGKNSSFFRYSALSRFKLRL